MSNSSRILALALIGMVASWYLLPGLWARLLTFLGRVMTGLRSRTRTIDGVRWHYLEGGRGPVLVLLHGMAAESDHWLAVAGNLRRHFRLLIPDLPGFGASEPAAKLSFRIADQATRLGAWLDDLGVDQCCLAGNSMGGWIISEFAARNPDRVQALWLQNPLGVMSSKPSEMLQAIARGERNPFSVSSMAEFRQLADGVLKRKYYLPYPLVRTAYRLARRLHPHIDRMQDEVIGQSEPIEKLAPHLTMPVLIEWGQEDRAVHVSGADVLHPLLPRSEVVIRAGVGHLPMLESPYESARHFLDFTIRNGVVQPSAAEAAPP